VKRFALCYQTIVCPVCLSVCDDGVRRPNGWTDQDETCHAGRPQPWPHCVRWLQLPSPKRGQSPLFRPISVVAKWAGWMDQDATGYEGRGHSPGNFVLDDNTVLSSRKGVEPPPQFSAHVYSGQMAGWIKTALGMEVGLGPGHDVAWTKAGWGPSSPPQKLGRSSL